MTIPPTQPTLRIAVIINIAGPSATDMIKAFAVSLAPGAHEVDFFDPVDAQIYPDVRQYDLIVLGGGNTFVMDDIPWINKEREWIRETVRQYPDQKIFAICWGHQMVATAFGGSVHEMGWAEIGVTKVPLTEAGKKFFTNSLPSPSSYRVNQWHKREVLKPAKGFIPLAEGSQMFVNATNTILTMQGHPEMSSKWAAEIYPTATEYIKLAPESPEEIERKLAAEQDGPLIWQRVSEWVREV